MLFIYPNVIMPMFNKFEPLQDAGLKAKIEELADKHSFPLTQLFQMDGSKRSSHSNAFMYGLWKAKRIVIFDTLLKQSHGEILAVLCHEIGHWAHYHPLWNMGISSAHIFAMFWAYSVFIANYGRQVAFDFGLPLNDHGQMPFVLGLFAFQWVYAPIEELLSILVTFHSRVCEYQADAFAVKAGRAKELSASLQKLQIDNLSEMDPDWLYSAINFSHPSLIERLKAIEAKTEDYVMVDEKKKTK